jgi:hypothetical protein
MKHTIGERANIMNLRKRVTKGSLESLLFLLALLLLACQMQQVDPAAEQKKQVAELIGKGQAALQKDQLIAPDNDCAVYYFRQVLSLVPDQPQAQEGMQAVFNRYLDFARTAHNSGDFTQALAMVDQAELILPPTTISQAMRVQILEEQARVAAARAKKLAAAKAKGVDYLLSIEGLDKKDDKIRQRLKVIAEHVRTIKGFIRIEARNDAEGRWIYEQMKQDEPHYSFHPDIHHSQHPKIVVLKPDT